jgi:hypothetical protein
MVQDIGPVAMELWGQECTFLTRFQAPLAASSSSQRGTPCRGLSQTTQVTCAHSHAAGSPQRDSCGALTSPGLWTHLSRDMQVRVRIGPWG